MDGPQLQAYCQMAQAMARFVFDMATWQTEVDFAKIAGDPKFAGVQRPIFWHISTSIFENATDDLAKLAILSEVSRAHYTFCCDWNNSLVLAERNWQAGPSFEEILINFINLFGEYGPLWGGGFSTSRDTPFGINSRLAPAVDALAAIGYLSKADEGYVWNDVVASTMNKSYYCWDEITPPAAT